VSCELSARRDCPIKCIFACGGPHHAPQLTDRTSNMATKTTTTADTPIANSTTSEPILSTASVCQIQGDLLGIVHGIHQGKRTTEGVAARSCSSNNSSYLSVISHTVVASDAAASSSSWAFVFGFTIFRTEGRLDRPASGFWPCDSTRAATTRAAVKQQTKNANEQRETSAHSWQTVRALSMSAHRDYCWHGIENLT
jgi:hypothetical protein